MKLLALNGSRRKTWNTAALLNRALEGDGPRIPRGCRHRVPRWAAKAEVDLGGTIRGRGRSD